MKLRKTIGILFIISQIVLIIYAKFVPERFFCWAPFDEHTYLDVDVEVNGEFLTKKQIEQRYHYKALGWEPRSINNVFSIIRQYESTYGKEDNAQVKVKCSTNGNEERIWYLNH